MASQKSNMGLDYKVIGVTPVEYQELIFETFMGALEDKKLPQPIMCWGPPGMGKTFSVYAAARKLAAQLGVEVEVYDLLTSTLDPSDVAGVPWPKEVDGHRYSEYVPPDWAWFVSEEFEKAQQAKDPKYKAPPAILFFDDLAAAHFQTQNGFYKGVHQGQWGKFNQRKNVLLLGAGNRQNDNTGANDMPRALASRFEHCYFNASVEGWLKWAEDEGNIHPYVNGFLRRKGEHFNEFNEEVANREEKPYACARTWEMVSRRLWQNRIKPNTPLFDKIIMGTVGRGIATEFLAYLQNTTAVVPAETIVKNPKTAPVPGARSLDALYATVESLKYYVKNNTQHWKATLEYAMRKEMLDEAGVLLAHAVMKIIHDFPEKQRQAAVMDSKLFDAMYERYANIISTIEGT